MMHITRRLYEYFIMGEGAYCQGFFWVLFPLERYLDFLILLIQGLIVKTWLSMSSYVLLIMLTCYLPPNLSPGTVKLTTIELIFVASLISMFNKDQSFVHYL
jgi:hypothetical protein